MENQKEFDELVRKVDSLKSIQDDLIREFQDNSDNPSPQLISRFKSLDAELKDVQDRLSKVEIDEDEPEPTGKVDTDFKSGSDSTHKVSNPTATEEGYGTSETKINLSNVDGANTTDSVQDFKAKLRFLDYQEGKSFNSGNKLYDGMCFQVISITNIEVKDSNGINQNFSTEFQQFEDRRLITDVKLNHSTSYIFQFVKLLSRKTTSVCVVLSCYDSVYILFDRGKEFDESVLRSKYTKDFVYKLVLELGNGVELLIAISKERLCVVVSPNSDFDCTPFDRGKECEVMRRYLYYYHSSLKLDLGTFWCSRVLHGLNLILQGNANFIYEILESGYCLDSLFANSNVSEFSKKGAKLVASELFAEIPQQVNVICTISRLYVTHLPLMLLVSRASLLVWKRMIDQGLARDISFLTQMGQVQKGFLATTSNSSQKRLNCTSMTVSGLFLIWATGGKCLFDCLVLARMLFDRGKLFESTKREGNCSDVSTLRNEMMQQVKVLQRIVILQLTRQSEFLSAQKQIYDQWVHAEPTSFLCYDFGFSAADEGWLNWFRIQACHPAVVWSSQVIRVYKLEDGVPWFHGYPLMVVSLTVERDSELLKLKRGYRGVGFCERLVEIQRILIGANSGESVMKELLEETSDEVVGVFTQLGFVVQQYSFMVNQIYTHSRVVEAFYEVDYILNRKLLRICVAGLHITLDCARYSIFCCCKGGCFLVFLLGINNCDMMKVSLVKGNKRKAFLNCSMGDTLTTFITLHHRDLSVTSRVQRSGTLTEYAHIVTSIFSAWKWSRSTLLSLCILFSWQIEGGSWIMQKNFKYNSGSCSKDGSWRSVYFCKSLSSQWRKMAFCTYPEGSDAVSTLVDLKEMSKRMSDPCIVGTESAKKPSSVLGLTTALQGKEQAASSMLTSQFSSRITITSPNSVRRRTTRVIMHNFKGKVILLVNFSSYNYCLSPINGRLTSVYTVTSRPATYCTMDFLVLINLKFISDSQLMRGYSQVRLENGEKSELQGNKEEIISQRKDWQARISVLEVEHCPQIQLHMETHVHASTVGVRSLILESTHTIDCYAILKLIFRDIGGVLTSICKAVGYGVIRSVLFRKIRTEYSSALGSFETGPSFIPTVQMKAFSFLGDVVLNTSSTEFEMQ